MALPLVHRRARPIQKDVQWPFYPPKARQMHRNLSCEAQSRAKQKIEKIAKPGIEGFTRTGLFHPWARWGRGPAAGNSSVSSSRDRVGMRRAGVRARHTSPDEETSTRRGNKHSTRKQGHKHSTRKRALNKEDAPYLPLFPVMFSYVAHAGPLFVVIF